MITLNPKVFNMSQLYGNFVEANNQAKWCDGILTEYFKIMSQTMA